MAINAATVPSSPSPHVKFLDLWGALLPSHTLNWDVVWGWSMTGLGALDTTQQITPDSTRGPWASAQSATQCVASYSVHTLRPIMLSQSWCAESSPSTQTEVQHAGLSPATWPWCSHPGLGPAAQHVRLGKTQWVAPSPSELHPSLMCGPSLSAWPPAWGTPELWYLPNLQSNIYIFPSWAFWKICYVI